MFLKSHQYQLQIYDFSTTINAVPSPTHPTQAEDIQNPLTLSNYSNKASNPRMSARRQQMKRLLEEDPDFNDPELVGVGSSIVLPPYCTAFIR